MAIPQNPVVWAQKMDPAERLDYLARFGVGSVLEPGEAIADFSVALLPEATALGISITETPGKSPRLVEGNTSIYLWFEVDPDFHSDVAFDGPGVVVGVEFTLTTTADRARVRQRTYALSVGQQ